MVKERTSELEQEETKLLRYNHILEGINRILSHVVQAETEEDLGNVCLSVALDVTGSQIGFVGEVGSDGLLHDIAISDIGWNQCTMYDKTGHRRPPGDFILHGLYGRVIDNGRGFFTNDPVSHPDSIGLPSGHPSLKSFLGIPLIEDGKVIGVLVVANREGGYSCEQQEDLEAIAPAIMQALKRKREEEERKKAEEALAESKNRYLRIFTNNMVPMAVWTKSGYIIDANDALLKLIGYTRAELEDREIRWDELTPPEYYKRDLQAIAELEEHSYCMPYEKHFRHKDGHLVPIIIGGGSFDEREGTGVFFAIDITEQKRAEKALVDINIARKKEIHHRIKNNLQVISSLLDLQAEQFRDKEYIKDSEVLEALRESQDRVISMALIHEELYKGGGFDTLNFSLYIEELAQNLLQTYCIGNSGISLNFDLADDIFFDMDTAVPLGMIVNELVSNSLKHAFPEGKKGEIKIELHREEEHKREYSKITSFTMIIFDNGVGIPEDLDIENLDSLGMQLVTSLVDQLDGEFELKRKNGTEFTMRFAVTEKDSQAPAPAAQQQLM